MDQPIRLSPVEQAAIEQVCFQHQRPENAAFPRTLPYYLGRLSRTIAHVEKGYPLSIDDYTNDLCVRDIFQEMIAACPDNASLLEWIKSWDERFDAATKPVNRSLLPRMDDREQGWWWFRVPIQPGKPLKEWLDNYWDA